MSKIKSEQMVKDFKYMESERMTFYYNRFPYNCGYLWPNNQMSFDCIGLIKSYINYPKIAYKTKPKGFYVQPGLVVPDSYGIVDLMNACTKRSRDFRSVPACSLLKYEDNDHGGLFVGQFKDPSGIVNTIECCDDPVGNGVVTSYTAPDGGRWDHKGGSLMGFWTEHGLMTKWVEYPASKKKSVTAIAKEVINGKWGNYPERKKKLEAAGYNYEAVQKKVDELLKK